MKIKVFKKIFEKKTFSCITTIKTRLRSRFETKMDLRLVVMSYWSQKYLNAFQTKLSSIQLQQMLKVNVKI